MLVLHLPEMPMMYDFGIFKFMNLSEVSDILKLSACKVWKDRLSFIFDSEDLAKEIPKFTLTGSSGDTFLLGVGGGKDYKDFMNYTMVVV